MNVAVYKELRTGLMDIYVFHSNTQGIHGAGSALLAREQYGAKIGKAQREQGRSYAMMTKSLVSRTKIPKLVIETQILALYKYARANPLHKFYICCTAKGKYLTGYTAREFAAMYATIMPPQNILFEEGFAKLVNTTTL